jgi:hypothetical protein
MAPSPTVVERSVVPEQVWARLAAEEQRRVIRLMAHLAYHVVAEQRTATGKEIGDACPARSVETPC